MLIGVCSDEKRAARRDARRRALDAASDEALALRFDRHSTVKFYLSPARRYASAGASYGPVSVSVCHKSVFCRNG